MPESSPLPELQEILGALILASREPVSLDDLRRALRETAEIDPATASGFAGADRGDIRLALESLVNGLAASRAGFRIAEVAGGYKLQTDARCGPWVRRFLQRDRPQRLSRPALETLAVIAYRQPVSRQEIESVRGVSVDHMLRALLEMQLIRITGRSDLPGRPMLYGTTRRFLEHFGLRGREELPGVSELARRDRAAVAAADTAVDDDDPAEADDNDGPEPDDDAAPAGDNTEE